VSSTSGFTTQWVSTDDGTNQRETFALPEAEIRRASRLFDLPENLVRAVILTESGGRADAVSSKGAVGYMQVLPSTGKEMGASDVRDPWQNLYAGAKYLRKQLDRFGNLEHALAAYNAGPGAVERHAGVPPYRETRRYVQRVLSWMDRLGARR
jgi:soluble lytic murein transglycosylase-like protein